MRVHTHLAFILGFILMLGIGWWAFPLALYEKIDQPVQFSHKTHTGENVGMACEDCHTFREDGSFGGIPTMDNCTGCHSELQGTSAAEKVLFEEYISKNREIPWLVYSRQPENVYFSHVHHVKLAEIDCERCHGPHGASEALPPYERNRISGYSRNIWGQSISGIRTAPWDGMKMDDCESCHADHNVGLSCMGCHK
ncbi:MAG TPA: cytochrome c3 family protein [Acidobacteriota bacterium]|nr:cytochrome c3 family protein [Acidobacteriota bacterium]